MDLPPIPRDDWNRDQATRFRTQADALTLPREQEDARSADAAAFRASADALTADHNAQQAALFRQQADALTARPPPALPTAGEAVRAVGGAVAGAAGDLVGYARQAARRAGIDPDLFVRQIQQESGFDPKAANPSGATGIAQIVPKYHPNVDPTDPYASLDYAANLMAQHRKTYGDDAEALAAYNGGQGAVDAMRAGKPYEETTAYLARILGDDSARGAPARAGAAPAVPSTAGQVSPPPARDLAPDQFGAGEGLSTEEAYAACGPAAAVAFARANGRNPTLREAVDLAKNFGWTAEGGMNGFSNQVALLESMRRQGLVGSYEADTRADPEKMAHDAASGNPVAISTSHHYYVASGYDPQTRKFYVGATGKARKGGSEWMSLEQISHLDGGVNGVIYADSPASPAPSVSVSSGTDAVDAPPLRGYERSDFLDRLEQPGAFEAVTDVANPDEIRDPAVVRGYPRNDVIPDRAQNDGAPPSVDGGPERLPAVVAGGGLGRTSDLSTRDAWWANQGESQGQTGPISRERLNPQTPTQPFEPARERYLPEDAAPPETGPTGLAGPPAALDHRARVQQAVAGLADALLGMVGGAGETLNQAGGRLQDAVGAIPSGAEAVQRARENPILAGAEAGLASALPGGTGALETIAGQMPSGREMVSAAQEAGRTNLENVRLMQTPDAELTPEEIRRKREIGFDVAMGVSGGGLGDAAAPATEKIGRAAEEAAPEAAATVRRGLPALVDNYLKPLKTYTDRLFHETDAGHADEFLPLPGKFERPASGDHTFLANTPDLALGQGTNRGVLLEFDSGAIRGQVNTAKPMWQPAYDAGEAEFVARTNPGKTYEDALRSVTVKPQVAGGMGERVRLRRNLQRLEDAGWAKTANEDGSVTYTRPSGGPSSAAPGLLSGDPLAGQSTRVLAARAGAGALAGQIGTDEDTPLGERAVRGVVGAEAALRLGGVPGVGRRLGAVADEGAPRLLGPRGEPITPVKGDVTPILNAAGEEVKRVAVRLPRPVREEFLQPEAKMAPQNVSTLRRVFDRARNVIESTGPAGEELGQRIHEWREGAETEARALLDRMPTVDRLSKPEFAHMVDVLEGNAKPAGARVVQAAAEAKGVLDDVYSRAANAGVDVKERIGNYFPHTYKQDLVSRLSDTRRRAEAIRHLMETRQAADPEEAQSLLNRWVEASNTRRQGSLEMERLANLPGYEKTKEALYHHVLTAMRRTHEVAQFGRDDAIAGRLLNRIRAERGNQAADVAEGMFKAVVGANRPDELLRNISALTRFWNSATSLGLSAVLNATQSVNTATVTGTLRTLQAAAKAGWSREARAFADSTGATLETLMREVREGAGFSDKLGDLTAPGFTQVETFNRRVAAIAGRDFAREQAQAAARGSRQALRALEKMRLDAQAIVARGGKLTPEEEIRAARNIVERTQFRVDPQDLPGWASSPLGRMVAQFQTFSYGQSAFVLREILDEAKNGNALPLVRFAILAPLAQTGATEVRNRISGGQTDDPLALRYAQGALGSLGVVGDMSRSFFGVNARYATTQERATRAVLGRLGPTAGRVIDLGTAVGDAGELAFPGTDAKGQPRPTEDNLRRLGRFALRQIPVAAQLLPNRVFPSPNQAADESEPVQARRGGAVPRPPAPPRPPRPARR